MAENVKELTRGEFDGFVKDGFVVVDFFADWCMPCLIMAPVMEELGRKLKGKVKFAKIDVDENQDLAQKFRVMSIPNFVLLKDGEVVERFVGAMPMEDFEARLRKHLK